MPEMRSCCVNECIRTHETSLPRKVGKTMSDAPLTNEQCDDIDPPEPKCTDAPKRIWLVIGDLDEDCKFDDLADVSWSSEQIGNQDIEYVRDDTKAAMECRALGCQRDAAYKVIEELRASNTALINECMHYRKKLRELSSAATDALTVTKS